MTHADPAIVARLRKLGIDLRSLPASKRAEVIAWAGGLTEAQVERVPPVLELGEEKRAPASPPPPGEFRGILANVCGRLR